MGIRTGGDDIFIGDCGNIICEWIGYSEGIEYIAYFGYGQWSGYDQWIRYGGYCDFHRNAAEDGDRGFADDQLPQ